MSLLAYHQRLFDWHCQNFFRFDRHLTETEFSYFLHCANLAEAYVETSPAGSTHLSYYTYSHRIRHREVNSTRMAMGSIENADKAWPMALKVLLERGIESKILPDSVFSFYGLGWDFHAGHFKLYFYIQDISKLPQHWQHLHAAAIGSENQTDEDMLAEGLVSFTYRGTEICEEKLYVYPKEAPRMPGAQRQALMSTTERAVVPQYDVENIDDWYDRLNASGKHIVDLYRTLNEPLDTLAYKDREDFTLYFP